MLKLLIFFASTVLFSACTTTEVAYVQKIKNNERLYFGNVFIDFNGMKNNEARCDLFTNSSMTSEFKTSESGFVSFISSTKKPRITEIACLFEAGREKFWVHYPLELNSINKSQDPQEATYFGDLYITWTITTEDIENSDSNKTLRLSEKIIGKGEFVISTKETSSQSFNKFNEIYPNLKHFKIRTQPYNLKTQE